MDGNGVNLEVQRLARGQPSGNQVFHDLLLPVDRDSATGQLLKIQSMSGTGKVKAETLMLQAFLHQARADAGLIQDVHALMLKDTGPYTFFHVVLVLRFQHHAFDAMLMQEVSQQQASRPRSNDRYLCAHGGYTVSIITW